MGGQRYLEATVVADAHPVAVPHVWNTLTVAGDLPIRFSVHITPTEIAIAIAVLLPIDQDVDAWLARLGRSPMMRSATLYRGR